MKSSLLLVFFISASAPVLANSLECSKDQGIKNCQEEATKFCEGDSFTLKSSAEKYIVTCEKAEEEVDRRKKEDSEGAVSQKTFPHWRFAIGLGFNSSGTAESDLRVTNTNTFSTSTGSVEFDVESGFNVNFEARYLRRNGWGFTLGLDLDTVREVKSGTITLGGNTVNVSDATDPDEFRAFVVYGNLVYRWEQFYIPFGFNLSYLDYDSTGLNVNTSSSLGAQLGVGFEVGDHFAFEIFSRVLGFELDYIDSNLDILFEKGMISNAALRVKYIF